MQWNTIEQLIRIVLYSLGSYFFGDAVAEGELFQAALGGVVAVAAFVWWAVRERNGGAMNALRVLVPFVIVITAFTLTACETLSSRAVALETLAQTCRSYAGALRVLTPHRAAGLLTQEDVRRVDLANQVADPLCREGAEPPADIPDAIAKVNQSVTTVLLVLATVEGADQ